MIFRLLCCFTLPEWQEDDRLNREELQNGIKGSEKVLGAEVEEEECVEGQRNGHVVDEGDVEVTLVRVPIAVLVETVGLQPDRDERHDRLHDAELKGGLEKKYLRSRTESLNLQADTESFFAYPWLF